MTKNILEMLENSAERFPNKIAFTDESVSASYLEFMNNAKKIGTSITKMGKTKAPIAVFIDKSVACLEAMMGVVYSGNFYAVIDTTMPKDRIAVIFNTLSPAAIITTDENIEKAKELLADGEIISCDKAKSGEIDAEKLAKIRKSAIDTDPIYALFTSGSTGVPKGAVICHRSVIDYAHWVCDTFEITNETVFASQTPFYFSMSVLDIFSTINSGATFHIVPQSLFSFPINLIKFLNKKKVNTIYWVPSALCIIANWKALDEAIPNYLKKVLFAGEVMPTKQLNIWIEKMPSDTLFANLYGPTEITDICTYYVVDRKIDDNESLPIGYPCDNCDILILRDDGTTAKNGEEGELCVRGSFLALGYYNNPIKTSESFVQNPLNPYYPELIYKTGDLVKINERGEIIYVSRKDFQIKHMGYRIELGEIETAVSAIEGIEASVCVYDGEKDRIVLIYQSETLTKKDILAGVSNALPKYMYPNKLIKIDKMPYNRNGKIDRAYLKNNYNSLK
ncbi:MAG: amino acid adenylation domain-containing protein [Oscillospiraceae bacterium]